MNAPTLTIETDDERDILRQVVKRVTHDYPFAPDLAEIETAIGRLTTCARLLRMMQAGQGGVDEPLLAELRQEERDLVEAVACEQINIDQVSAPDADPEEWRGSAVPLPDVRREIEEERDNYLRELARCRRLIARAEAVA